jgi:hypothetical protein
MVCSSLVIHIHRLMDARSRKELIGQESIHIGGGYRRSFDPVIALARRQGKPADRAKRKAGYAHRRSRPARKLRRAGDMLLPEIAASFKRWMWRLSIKLN